jgi:flagellar basal body P-ring formation protein FlgA
MRTVTFLGLLVFASVALAGNDTPAEQSPRTIRQAAHTYLVAQARQWSGDAQIEVSDPDPRLRLARCDKPLQAEFAPGARAMGNTTVWVRCPGSSPWSFYLPAQVRIFAEVLVAAHPLARDVALTESDFKTSRQDLAAAAGSPLTVTSQAVGKHLRYPVAAGTILGARMLESPPLVRRGQPVTIVSGAGGVEIRAAGEALADGGNGDTIRVRNTQTRRVLDATVQESGLVRVPM